MQKPHRRAGWRLLLYLLIAVGALIMSLFYRGWFAVAGIAIAVVVALAIDVWMSNRSGGGGNVD